MKKTILTLALLFLVGLAERPHSAEAAINLGVSLHPDHIQIGADFNGAQISVTGRVPSGASALIRLTGPPEDRHLKQKGRALGVLWMNLGSVEISNVPSVFLLYLPEDDAPSPAKTQPTWQSLGLGIEGLAAKAAIVAPDTDQTTIFNEFVKLKGKFGLYGVMPKVVRYGPDDGIHKTFQATLALPAALPQGDYRIEVLAIQDGAVSTSAIQTIDAREIGMPAWISAMAFNHGTLYGILAVLVAVIAGLATGILFKDKGGAH